MSLIDAIRGMDFWKFTWGLCQVWNTPKISEKKNFDSWLSLSTEVMFVFHMAIHQTVIVSQMPLKVERPVRDHHTPHSRRWKRIIWDPTI